MVKKKQLPPKWKPKKLEENAEYMEWLSGVCFSKASMIREFIAAQRWTLKKSAEEFGVSAQTVCNWKRTGKYSDLIYRKIYESDWGQMRFNPGWPDTFLRCGVGYTFEEKIILSLEDETMQKRKRKNG